MKEEQDVMRKSQAKDSQAIRGVDERVEEMRMERGAEDSLD